MSEATVESKRVDFLALPQAAIVLQFKMVDDKKLVGFILTPAMPLILLNIKP